MRFLIVFLLLLARANARRVTVLAAGEIESSATDALGDFKNLSTNDLVALGDHEFLVLERDNLGRDGSNKPPAAKYKALWIINTRGATNLIETPYAKAPGEEHSNPCFGPRVFNSCPRNCFSSSRKSFASFLAGVHRASPQSGKASPSFRVRLQTRSFC